MLKRFIVGLTFVCFVGGAFAQADNNDATRIINGVTYDDLVAFVESQGHTLKEARENDIILSAQTDDGVTYLLNGTACNSSNFCRGLNMIVLYTVADRIDPIKLNQADKSFAAVAVWEHDDKQLAISRYIILDKGMSWENLTPNLNTLIAGAEKVLEKVTGATPDDSKPSTLNYGDDSGSYANDGACDDARFHTDGDDSSYKRKHVGRDASDCRQAVSSGEVNLRLDFGDDSGSYANDGTCDDNRFSGKGRSILATSSHVRKDATDCIAAYRNGLLNR